MNARKQGLALDVALWGVAALVAYFSLQNVTAFAVEHGTPFRTAVVLAPMVDIALVAALVADGILSRGGVVSTGWGTLLRWFAGVATLTFNVWGSVARADIAAVVLHAVPPLLLILLAEAAPQYRRQFAALADRTRTASAEDIRTAPLTAAAGGPDTTTDRADGPQLDLREQPVTEGGPAAAIEPVRTAAVGAVSEAVRPAVRTGPARRSVVRSARSAKAVSRRRPDVADLLPTGRSVAAELERTGRSLSRTNVVSEFRSRGQSVSTDRAGELVRQLRSEPHLHAVNGD